MKKYLLGIFAIATAISLSAFTSQKPTAAHQKAMDSYFWYHVNALGKAEANSPEFGGSQETQAFADNNNTCTSGNNADCIRGYLTQLSADDPSQGDAVPIRKQ